MPDSNIANPVESFKVPVRVSLTNHYDNVRKRLYKKPLIPAKTIKITINCEFCGSKNVPVTHVPPPLTIHNIIKFVGRNEQVLVTDIIAHRRLARFVHARQIAMYLAKRLTNQSLPIIGRVFNRDHTTIMHGVWAVEKKMVESERYAEKINTYAVRLGEVRRDEA